MKAKLEIVKNKFSEILKDESAQGATEYILLVVVVVAIFGLFREKITTMVETGANDVAAKFSAAVNQ